MIKFSWIKNYKTILIHTAFWLGYIILGTLQRITQHLDNSINIVDILLTLLPGIYVFYGSAWLFFRYLPLKQYIRLSAAMIGMYISYVAMAYVFHLLAPFLIPVSIIASFNAVSFLVAALWVFFNRAAFAFGYYFALRSVNKEQELRMAEKKQMQAQQETLIAEYSFLRSQINPHFLHNTLNFFYAKSLTAAPALSDAILTLSEIMRYSLEKEDDKDGLVQLSREIDNLKKVIKINELRFSNRLNIELTIEGNISTIRIIPLVLITLLENAFKHGDLINPAAPVTIMLKVDENDTQLYFFISNRKKTGPKELGHGIGMDNIRRRLDFTYHDNYRLAINDTDSQYTVELTIRFPENDIPALVQPLAGTTNTKIQYNKNNKAFI